MTRPPTCCSDKYPAQTDSTNRAGAVCRRRGGPTDRAGGIAIHRMSNIVVPAGFAQLLADAENASGTGKSMQRVLCSWRHTRQLFSLSATAPALDVVGAEPELCGLPCGDRGHLESATSQSRLRLYLPDVWRPLLASAARPSMPSPTPGLVFDQIIVPV